MMVRIQNNPNTKKAKRSTSYSSTKGSMQNISNWEFKTAFTIRRPTPLPPLRDERVCFWNCFVVHQIEYHESTPWLYSSSWLYQINMPQCLTQITVAKFGWADFLCVTDWLDYELNLLALNWYYRSVHLRERSVSIYSSSNKLLAEYVVWVSLRYSYGCPVSV